MDFDRSDDIRLKLFFLSFVLSLIPIFYLLLIPLLNVLTFKFSPKCFLNENINLKIEPPTYNKCYFSLKKSPLVAFMPFPIFIFLDGLLLRTVDSKNEIINGNTKFINVVAEIRKISKSYIIKHISFQIIWIIVFVFKLCIISFILFKDTIYSTKSFKFVENITEVCDFKNDIIKECKNAMDSISNSISKFQIASNSTSFLNMTNCDLKGDYKAVCTITRSKIMLFIFWLWVIIVLMFCLYSLSKFIIGLTKQSRMNFIKKYLIRHDIKVDGSNKEMLNSFVYKYLKQDGVLMLRIAINCVTNGEELIFEQWDEFKSGAKNIENYGFIDI